MIRNYLKIALRNFTKHPAYSFINITGLSVGITSAILILLWVADEMSFDRFHRNYDRLYQVQMNQKFVDGIHTQKAMPYPLKEAIINKSSQVKHVVMTNWGEGNLLTVGNNRLTRVGVSVSEDFLKIFSFKLLKGNPETALADPSSIVLTESSSRTLFGEEDPINQLVKIDNDRELKVSGVLQDLPAQSTLKFDYILPFAFYEATQIWVRNSRDSWGNNGFLVYVELQPDALLSDANKSISTLVRDNNKESITNELFLHPMSQWRLYSNFRNGKVSGGMIEYVRLFTIIAVFVLVIACINFMNLATARSESRAREVGIRKSVGSRRKELIFQFLGESFLITLVAFLVALLMAELLLPVYNTMVNKKLFIDYTNGWLWLSALVLVFVTGIIAGSYPAFYLSAFQPVQVLKGKIMAVRGATAPRKVLVTLQFGFSILLIVGTVVVHQQIQFVKSREIGYDNENLMMVWTNNDIDVNLKSIREELLRTGAVKSVTKSNSPVTDVFSSNTVEWPGKQDNTPVSFSTVATEYDYTETMGIHMVEGRDFSRDFKSDTTAIIINQTAAKLINLKEPIGTKLRMWDQEWKVIGIMEDVIMGSPYEPIKPLVMIFVPGWSTTLTLKIERTNDLPAAIAKIEGVMKKYNPSYPFNYRFADVEFDKKFTTISLISKLSDTFATLAIVITCLGLFGLAAFTAEQRTKEIGIRKVMGATVSSLVLLITRDFSRLVLIAFAISAPLAWWTLNNFLERYPYRIAIPWWVLPLAGTVALVLTLGVVTTQALRAATRNPSNSLRSE